MKRFCLYILLPLLSLCVASCEDKINIDLKTGERILVVDGFLTDQRKVQTVRLTYTDAYFSQTNTPAVPGATVQVNDLTNGKTFNFTDKNNGNYEYDVTALNDTLGIVGHNYQLLVKYASYQYTGYATMVRTAPIDTITTEYQDGSGFQDSGYYCTMVAKDLPGPVIDYYWVRSYHNGIFNGKGGEINISQDAGGTGTDGFYFIPPVAQGITPFDKPLKYNDLVRVEIWGIQESTYKFLQQVQTQTTNGGLFATTPENVKTNMTVLTNNSPKVIGWFSVSAVDMKEVYVK